MMRRDRRSRGVALLIVLATIALLVPPCVALARAATTARVRARLDADSALAQKVMPQAEVAMLDWLTRASSSVILPPDVPSPCVRVLDERLAIGAPKNGDPSEAREVEATITAWDECGMAPLQVLSTGSPLRLALPREVVAQVDRCRRLQEPFGLDAFLEESEERSPFPTAETSRREPSRTVGSWVATHNPGRGKINVHTIPIRLLEAALREAGRGGIEQVEQARAEKRAVSLGSLPPLGGDGSVGPELVTQSESWAFRLELRCGASHESWWIVWSLLGEKWHVVQRLFIPD